MKTGCKKNCFLHFIGRYIYANDYRCNTAAKTGGRR
jgi:hypothetical protein